jgi:transcription-repair coupling factor (superfamily II helicase)
VAERKARSRSASASRAERLIRTAAERALRRPRSSSPPEGVWDQFLARFPYVETDDQLQAIEDVLTTWRRAPRWTG